MPARNQIHVGRELHRRHLTYTATLPTLAYFFLLSKRFKNLEGSI